jgi:hypothetical protein
VTFSYTVTDGALTSTALVTVRVHLPELSINDVSILEGSVSSKAVTFVITLSERTTQSVLVRFDTLDGTATAGSDYVRTGGTINLAAGMISMPVSVTILADTRVEADETFRVVISSTAAPVRDGEGVGTILDDD